MDIAAVFGQLSGNLTYTLDLTAPDLYFDLKDISPLDFLIVETTPGNSLDMFVAGNFTTSLNIYELYEGSQLIGRMGDLSIFSGKYDSRVPLKFSASKNLILIANKKNNIFIDNISLFFRMYNDLNCPVSIIQRTTADDFSIAGVFNKGTFIGNACTFKIITWGSRPRNLKFSSLKTNAVQDIVVTGGSYNQSVPYFTFNHETASNFGGLSLYGSVFSFHVQDQEETQITINFYDIPVSDYKDLIELTAINQTGVITSPDYAEIKRYQPTDTFAIFSMTSEIYFCNSHLLNIRFQLMERSNFGSNTIFYIQSSNDDTYVLNAQDLKTPFWIEGAGANVYYKDSMFSSFVLVYVVDGCKQVVQSTSMTYLQPRGTGTSASMIVTETSPLPLSSDVTDPPRHQASSLTKWILISSIGILLLIGGLMFCIFWPIYKRTCKIKVEKILEQLDKSSAEWQLSHEERVKMFFDIKEVSVEFDNVLGRGSCATVYKAFIKSESPLHLLHESILTSKYANCEAAFKLPRIFNDSEKELFVRELDALIKLSPHPHIIALLGWTIHELTPALVVEMAQSNLLTYVKGLRNQELPLKKLLSIIWQISQALEHIATFSMVHRDVACRNILLTDDKTAKLADFGLCCYCNNTFTYKADPSRRLPIKWLSIEALADRIFSEKSDVWSFGVLCYEVFSYGSIPYSTIQDTDMRIFLEEGNRLEKSAATPEFVFELMLSCWKEEPKDRPSFSEIGSFFYGLLENETRGYGYLAICSEVFGDECIH